MNSYCAPHKWTYSYVSFVCSVQNLVMSLWIGNFLAKINMLAIIFWYQKHIKYFEMWPCPQANGYSYCSIANIRVLCMLFFWFLEESANNNNPPVLSPYPHLLCTYSVNTWLCSQSWLLPISFSKFLWLSMFFILKETVRLSLD